MESYRITSAMLMAAGLGTRLRPFTDRKTKALLPVMGIPAAQFAVDSLLASGVEKLVANVHHDASQTTEGIRSLRREGAQLIVSDESKLLLGSAGGIRKAIAQLGSDPFFLANADVLCDVDWLALAKCHQRLRESYGAHITLAVFPAGPAEGAYREIHFDAQSSLITGLGNLAKERPFFIGAAVIEPEALAGVPPEGPAEFVPTILEPAIQKKKAGVFLTNGVWYDIGSPLLWLNTHLSLIQDLEKHRLRNRYAENWRVQILENNIKLSENIWISKNAPKLKTPGQWKGPCYWGRTESGPIEPPQSLGPGTVLYDSVSGVETFSEGIGYGGHWVNLSR